MTRRFSRNGIPGSDVASYYRLRAAAGLGLIVTEGVHADAAGAALQPSVPVSFGGAALAAWRDLVAGVHEHGTAIFPQLWHAHLPASSEGGDRRVTLRAAFDDWARAAAGLLSAGFDGLELQGGGRHSTDLFDTGLAGDRPLAAELVEFLRAEVGPGVPIAVRVGEWRRSDGVTPFALDDDELRAWLDPCVEAGVDLFDLETRDHRETAGRPVAGPRESLAGRVRALCGRPVVAVGAVAGADPEVTGSRLGELDAAIGRGEIDLVAIGRALIADAEWPEKLRRGRLDTAIPFHDALKERL